MSKLRHRVGVAAAALATAVTGLTVAAAAPAQAAPNCIAIFDVYYYNGAIEGSGDVACPYGPGEEYLLWITIDRKDPATGTWSAVSTGYGWASYVCNGTALTTYRVGTGIRGRQVTANCG
ncbi:hypothetical protein [Longispora urticae]